MLKVFAKTLAKNVGIFFVLVIFVSSTVGMLDEEILEYHLLVVQYRTEPDNTQAQKEC